MALILEDRLDQLGELGRIVHHEDPSHGLRRPDAWPKSYSRAAPGGVASPEDSRYETHVTSVVTRDSWRATVAVETGLGVIGRAAIRLAEGTGPDPRVASRTGILDVPLDKELSLER
jgi:hypothetical protein